MNARDEIERLKQEFVNLRTEDEQRNFDNKFRRHLSGKTDSEKREFASAFADAARADTQRIRKLYNEVTVRMKLEDILGIVSMAYIAKVYFHKSKSWFSQKLNGNLKNGEPSSFTEEELKTLSGALQDISVKIHTTARSIA
jgi:hypothetical protein